MIGALDGRALGQPADVDEVQLHVDTDVTYCRQKPKAMDLRSEVEASLSLGKFFC